MPTRVRRAPALACGGLLVVGGFFLLRGEPATVQADRPGASAGEAPASPALAATALRLNWDSWTALYAGASLAQVEEELESLRVYLFEETKVYYDEHFESGDYEVVTARRADGSYAMDFGDDLAAWRYLPSRQLVKVTLPREGFENAYEAKLRTEFLLDRQKELQDLEVQFAAAED